MDFSLSNKFIFSFQPRVRDNDIFKNKIDFKFLSKQVSAINIPGIGIGTTTQPTPILQLPQIGSGSKQYSDLNLTFYVDENWETFREIYTWLDLVYNSDIIQKGIKEAQINGSLILTDNFMKPKLSIMFFNVFPFQFSDINLTTNEGEVQEVYFNVVFKYNQYVLEE